MRPLPPIGLLLQGFSASLAGMPLDAWLASLSEQDRAKLTGWSKAVAVQVPGLLDAPELVEAPAQLESTDDRSG